MFKTSRTLLLFASLGIVIACVIFVPYILMSFCCRVLGNPIRVLVTIESPSPSNRKEIELADERAINRLILSPLRTATKVKGLSSRNTVCTITLIYENGSKEDIIVGHDWKEAYQLLGGPIRIDLSELKEHIESKVMKE